jgi:hypothetical protein
LDEVANHGELRTPQRPAFGIDAGRRLRITFRDKKTARPRGEIRVKTGPFRLLLLQDRGILGLDLGFGLGDGFLQQIQPFRAIFIGEPLSQGFHHIHELSFFFR